MEDTILNSLIEKLKPKIYIKVIEKKFQNKKTKKNRKEGNNKTKKK